MKNRGFKRLTYDEAIQKKLEQREQKLARPKSSAAKAGSKRKSKRQAIVRANQVKWKRAVRSRDNYRCQYPGCRFTSKHIHCHHICPRSQRRDLIYSVKNGICLCAKHHQWVHDNPLEAVQLGLLSKESRELANKRGDKENVNGNSSSESGQIGN